MKSTTNYVFVHGGGQGGWVWDETVAALRLQSSTDVGSIMTLDAPGCGTKRGRTTEGLDMEQIAREFVSEIERAGLSHVVLVGHSQAGQTLPMMARLRPDLFSHLVYVTCSAPLPGQSVQQMIGSGLHATNADEVGWPADPATTSMNDRYYLMFCNDMSEEQTAVFLPKLGKDMWPAATYSETSWRYDDCNDVPSTYILCLRDQSLPPQWQKRFAERLGARQIVRIDAGHQVMNSRPHALAEILHRTVPTRAN
jgi:pimeloyl-ACP methyl ester carboxylesterase